MKKLKNFDFGTAQTRYNNRCAVCSVVKNQTYKVKFKWTCKECILKEIDKNCTKGEKPLIEFVK